MNYTCHSCRTIGQGDHLNPPAIVSPHNQRLYKTTTTCSAPTRVHPVSSPTQKTIDNDLTLCSIPSIVRHSVSASNITTTPSRPLSLFFNRSPRTPNSDSQLTHQNELYNDLQEKYKILENETQIEKRKLSLKEKQIKAREAAVVAREANQKERDEQITLLKSHINELELRIKDLDDQNKLWKLKFLTSEEIRTSQQSVNDQKSTYSVTHRSPEQNDIICKLLDIISTMSNNITSSLAQRTTSTTPPPKITNIYQPGRSFNNKRNHHEKRHFSRQYNTGYDYNKPYFPTIRYDYNHGINREATAGYNDCRDTTRHAVTQKLRPTQPQREQPKERQEITEQLTQNTDEILVIESTIQPPMNGDTTQAGAGDTLQKEPDCISYDTPAHNQSEESRTHLDLTRTENEHHNTSETHHNNDAVKQASNDNIADATTATHLSVYHREDPHITQPELQNTNSQTVEIKTPSTTRSSFLEVVPAPKAPDPRK